MSKAVQPLLSSEQKGSTDWWEMQEVHPLTGAHQEMLCLPDIRCRLPRLPTSCTAQAEGGPGRRESFSHWEAEKSRPTSSQNWVRQKHLRQLALCKSSRSAHMSESIHRFWWEATPLPTHISCMWLWYTSARLLLRTSTAGITLWTLQFSYLHTRPFSGLLGSLESGLRLGIASWLAQRPQEASVLLLAQAALC